MGVFKVGRYWYACFSYKGVHHQESLHVEHKYEALRIFAKWKSNIIEQRWFPKDIGRPSPFLLILIVGQNL